MKTITENEIRVVLELNAPVEKVWRSLAEKSGFTSWFANKVEGEFVEGETVTLVFDGDSEDDCGGKAKARIDAIEPMSRFAYSWHPGGDGDDHPDDQMTLVEFLIEPNGEGTKLVMVESGFANISEARRENCFSMNSGGWDFQLKKLVALFNGD